VSDIVQVEVDDYEVQIVAQDGQILTVETAQQGPAGPQGTSGAGGTPSYTFTQVDPTDVWEFNIPERRNVSTFDNLDRQIYGSVSYPTGKVRIEFGGAESGYAVIS
jgi:hypothetical protein